MVTRVESLFAAHRERLFLYFCRAVGQAETAQDLTQDVFVRVSRAALPGDGTVDLRPWLFKIARNLALDHHRRRVRHAEDLVEAPERARAASQDTNLALHEALATLADLDRDVFLLREAAGLSYDEIARACDLTVEAVRSRIHRARLQLRATLTAPIEETRRTPLRLRGVVR
jgi:RNA polymerase sigma-70 factor (ECF subfamily)